MTARPVSLAASPMEAVTTALSPEDGSRLLPMALTSYFTMQLGQLIAGSPDKAEVKALQEAVSEAQCLGIEQRIDSEDLARWSSFQTVLRIAMYNLPPSA